jgi:glycerol-3-phosphate dehydrogenase (NAD(P)+)
MSGPPIGVIGAGAWGTALACVMAQNHDRVLLWAIEPEVVAAINGGQGNPLYLPNIPLPSQIQATGDMTDMADCSALLLVTPAQHLRATLDRLPDINAPLLLCSKGIEAGTQLLVSEVVAQQRPDNPLAVLSGPTFAHEVAAGKPTAITLACESQPLGAQLMRLVATPAFRPYWSDDVVGAEIGGAVKNVLAIGCGVVDGAGLGLNARAALIARGFAEMQRYGLARGARADTLGGLSGLGDLVLTCTGDLSRNRRLGLALGKGQTLAEAVAAIGQVVESVQTAAEVMRQADAHGIELPISHQVQRVLHGEITPVEGLKELLAREQKPEYPESLFRDR